MQRSLVVGSWGDCLQAIESLRTWAVAEISTCIVAPSDRPQAIESSTPRVFAGRPRGIEVSSHSTIRLSSSRYTTIVIKLLSEGDVSLQSQRQTSSRWSALLIMDACIHRRSISPIDEPIICQDAGEERSSLHHLEDALTRFLSLPLGSSLVNLGTQLPGPTYFSHTTL